MEHRISAAGRLLDGKGGLREPGWANKLLLAYDRADIKAPAWRIKEWDYYFICSGDQGLSLTIADNAYMGFVGATVFDFSAHTEVSKTLMPLLPMGRLGLPSDSSVGITEYAKDGVHLRFEASDGKRWLRVSWPGFGPGKGEDLEGEVLLEELPPRESMVIATPFARSPRAFYYNQKINCQEASGRWSLGAREARLEKGKAFGVLDWGRGVWTWRNTWLWGSASGIAQLSKKDVRFGFNIGYGFGDTGAASENMVFVDGVAHKIGRLSIELDDGDFLSPWKVRSEDGRLDLVLSPDLDRFSSSDFLVLASIQHQVFGLWNGGVVLEDGSRVEVRDLRGFCEKVRNRW
jgi:hypothetical protein